MALGIWDAAQLQDATPLGEWVERWPGAEVLVDIPEERRRFSDAIPAGPRAM